VKPPFRRKMQSFPPLMTGIRQAADVSGTGSGPLMMEADVLSAWLVGRLLVSAKPLVGLVVDRHDDINEDFAPAPSGLMICSGLKRLRLIPSSFITRFRMRQFA
jgi:hypothetical protein